MSSKIRSLLLIIFISILAFALYWASNFYRFIHQTPMKIDSAGYLVMVPPGISVHKIADNLSQAGVLEHPQWFLWWMQITGKRSQVKAGEYIIKPGTTPQGLIDLLVAGKVVQHAITIVEGWNFERLMQTVNDSPKLTHTLQGLSNKEIMAKLGHFGEHPEGQFFPDTYYFPANTTDIAFLQRAYRIMQEKLSQAWENRNKTLSLKSPYEALILASIIEKESCVPEEYTEIAGVYIRRLARNMPLQADPTVIYGLGKTYTGQLTLAHLRQPSSYNTYLNVGLPPTPIALPSQKALEAATRPKPGETLFFVATGTDKRHVFSKSEEEHQKAVARYRNVKAQIEKERSLAAQETAVIAEEEKMVAGKKERRTAEEKAIAKKLLQQVKETLAEASEPVPVSLSSGDKNEQPLTQKNKEKSAEGKTTQGKNTKNGKHDKTDNNSKKSKGKLSPKDKVTKNSKNKKTKTEKSNIEKPTKVKNTKKTNKKENEKQASKLKDGKGTSVRSQKKDSKKTPKKNSKSS